LIETDARLSSRNLDKKALKQPHIQIKQIINPDTKKNHPLHHHGKRHPRLPFFFKESFVGASLAEGSLTATIPIPHP